MTTNDRPMLGIMLMVAFCAIIPLGDSMAKILGGTIPLIQLLVVRLSFQAVILLPIVVIAGIPFRLSRHHMIIVVLRTAIFIAAMAAMFTALRFLPLADAVAIAFVMPFIMLLLGAVVLGEEVGPRRIAACTVGFAGTLLVIQPSFAEVGLPALLPLLVAVLFAFYMLVSRQIAQDCDPITLQAWSGLLGTPPLILLFMLTASESGPVLGAVMPNSAEAWLLAGIGVFGTGAHLLMTWSLRFAPSATLAPVQYLEIPFATFYGWLIFSHLPDGLAALGIAIIIAAGLYVLFREQRLARPRPPEG
ncbi:DMT family transporter [Notoacmeibacter sp. MSK16QG-6]|uniref:DMT family transporter n=1 Tax=Notoacmeibacter sp. MSK16QG-6 TaxID=2957982 RepID=UPI0020A15227|nr:DMT family transporter [Notoacmeibacter sp. MSK16QG-6]MCP1198453.1 DMT family transporter [Notoacmeibacter sp. MSK16QG-6]